MCQGEGEGEQRALAPPPLSKVGGGTDGSVPLPPQLVDRANVQISKFAHILRLKMQFLKKILGSLRLPTLIKQYFPNLIT